jgi:hypothetical protein
LIFWSIVMFPRIATFVFLLAAPAYVAADGCKFDRRGRTVPEREQRALVEWSDGVETLHVAALSDATTEGAVWIVPVRATSAAIRAEPIEEFPVVPYYETLRERAHEQLRNWIAVAAVLDSGGLCCPFFFGGCNDSKSAAKAFEASRVEKLGMIVTVVSAESRAALEEYLDAQGVNRSAANLSSLAQYFEKGEYAFVCGWVAKSDERVTATGLKIVFPSPTLWFPLLPTRAYTNDVETVVYTRGFVTPAPGCELPGLKCEYIYGPVKPAGLQTVFRKDEYFRNWSGSEPLTRVTLTADPQQWDRDLELVPGTTPVGTFCLALTGWGMRLGLVWPGLLGALLGLAIPLMTIHRIDRSWTDFAAGALTGAAIALSIWASVLVFCTWRNFKFRRHPWRRLLPYFVLPPFAIVHFGICLGACRALQAWIAASA